ncbi:RNase P and RNase MRP subunit [Ophidiomyces ophidiicola]|nr:RNase P and RNase MRP subunit [Ophidiomyces ophidiicola]KAI1985133.1 RNase P and RNase MRP subunit [Ophidiomyces ophidiicola]KAI1995945.1 RNase P and RNase MRP subunit [Ophidiomyces ophidiicola]KAI1997921.1 RNase P and RNase MRP subunit [Ophidiomyces ophidiicola]
MQEAIVLDLLSTGSPNQFGQHERVNLTNQGTNVSIAERRNAKAPSHGKRSTARRRRRLLIHNVRAISSVSLPDVTQHLTIGFNSTVRALEQLCMYPLQDMGKRLQSHDTMTSIQKKNATPLAAIFVCRSTLPAALDAPLPLLVKSASQKLPDGEKIRLVYLGENAEIRISKALGVPRAGVIGVATYASATVLIDYIRVNVPPLNDVIVI